MPTLEERVAALEVKIDAQTMSGTELRGMLAGLQVQMNQRFEQVDHRFVELQDQMNRRFEQSQNQMNQRFDSADQKTDRHFTWLVGIQVAVLVAVVGTLVGAYYR